MSLRRCSNSVTMELPGHKPYVLVLTTFNIGFILVGSGATITMWLYWTNEAEQNIQNSLPSAAQFENFTQRWRMYQNTAVTTEDHDLSDLKGLIKKGVILSIGLRVLLAFTGLVGCLTFININTSCILMPRSLADSSAEFIGDLYFSATAQIFVKVYIALLVLVIIINSVAYIFLQFLAGSYVTTAIEASFLPKYKGASYFEIHSLWANTYMVEYKCCGINDHRDFARASSWEHNYTLGTNVTFTIKVPIACCKLSDSFTEGLLLDIHCLIDPSATNSYYMQGCAARIQDAVLKFFRWSLDWGRAVITTQVACGVCAVVVMKVQQMQYDEETSRSRALQSRQQTRTTLVKQSVITSSVEMFSESILSNIVSSKKPFAPEKARLLQ